MVLAIRIAFLPGSFDGYKFIFKMDMEKLFDFRTWIAAMGQAFFSLSLVGSVMVVYGSYLSDDEDVIKASTTVAGLDTLAAII